MKLKDKIILITDSMRAKYLPEGESELGGQKVFVKNGELVDFDAIAEGDSVLSAKVNSVAAELALLQETVLRDMVALDTILKQDLTDKFNAALDVLRDARVLVYVQTSDRVVDNVVACGLNKQVGFDYNK